MTMPVTAALRGGGWLTAETEHAVVFTPERLDDEHRLIGRTADQFVDDEVLPVLNRLEAKDWDLARSLIRRGAELGLLGADVPEPLGGVGLDTAAALVVAESMGRCASFSTTFGAQTGLALTPLVCFGTDEQQARYVPRLVSGDLVGAYALSEAGSGSDALGARTRAARQPDGSFILDGEKLWITNGGFADLFIVFAKVAAASGAETGGFTAFIVERAFPGVGSGQEEHKMGLHGSSTTPLLLANARVPAENVLGEIGQGHRVAFNVLNYGRWKLGAMCSGGAKRVIAEAAAYAAARRQFGRPIADFGAVRHKLAEMAIRQFAVESMLYRTVGLIDGMLRAGQGSATAVAAFEEYAVESSMLKVAGSEMLDFVVDENVQIHGGNGFVRDYAAERHYRDARVNRIFEGTNEINRLLVPGMLVRRALKGVLPILDRARQVRQELAHGSPAAPAEDDAPLQQTARTVSAVKNVVVLVLDTVMRRYGDTLADEQELLTQVADLATDAYAAESVLLRATAAATPLHEAAARVFVDDAAWRAARVARAVLTTAADGRESGLLAAVRELLDTRPVDAVALRRQLAQAVLARRVYPF
jgi:alkylation response protein AidB-like acyl-CoA dehydrogenase